MAALDSGMRLCLQHDHGPVTNARAGVPDFRQRDDAVISEGADGQRADAGDH